MVESRCGAAAVGRTYLLPPLSPGGHCQLSRPWYARCGVAWRRGSEGPLLAYRAARLNRAGPQKGALGPLS